MNNTSDFAQNLKLLCSYKKSIAEVCRQMSFNRAQFNRYLNGRHRPTANTMRLICDFFGVEESEILMPHSQFRLLIQVRPKQSTSIEKPSMELQHLAALQKVSNHDLEKYLGYYFEYYMSMAQPGKLIRTLVCIEKQDNFIGYQRTERIFEGGVKKPYHSVYLGMAHFLVDRIYMIDYESLTKQEISQTILFPSFRNRITQLKGLKMGVSGSGERMPICARVVYEFLGVKIDVKKALALCGLFDDSTTEISPLIIKATQNNMEEGEFHFRARY